MGKCCFMDGKNKTRARKFLTKSDGRERRRRSEEEKKSENLWKNFSILIHIHSCISSKNLLCIHFSAQENVYLCFISLIIHKFAGRLNKIIIKFLSTHTLQHIDMRQSCRWWFILALLHTQDSQAHDKTMVNVTPPALSRAGIFAHSGTGDVVSNAKFFSSSSLWLRCLLMLNENEISLSPAPSNV